MGATAGNGALTAPRRGTRAWRPLAWVADRRVGLVAATGVALAAGLVAAWLTPRGPATTTEALGWIVGTILVGLVAGWLSGTRWSMLLGPIAFTVAFEVGRQGSVGPTVDAVQLGSTYGIIAFVVGRGLTYLLALLPLALGNLVGVQLAAWTHRAGVRPLGIVGWIVVGLGAVCVVGLGALFLRPASTPAVLGA